MEYLNQIIELIINNFDFTYCLVVNLLTYLIIKFIDGVNKDKEVKSWVKKVVLLVCILSTGVLYYIYGQDVKILVNSAILTPLAWSWIFKPICKKLGIDYRKIDKVIKE